MSIVIFLVIAALVVWGVVGALRSAAHDGYHRIGARDAAYRTPVSIES